MVSVCVLVTRMYCAKTVELIEMPFGGGRADLGGPKESYVRWG